MDEFSLIHRYFASLAAQEGAFSLRDDAACLPPSSSFEEGGEVQWVITQDALAAGVHFFESDPADLIAQKALRSNLSDLAAKGATPLFYFLTLMLPQNWSPTWMTAFARGLRLDQERFGVTLMGGDTIRVPTTLCLSLTALGTVPKGKMLRRATAQPGDGIYVSGSIGDAALGLQLRSLETSTSPSSTEAAALFSFLKPEERQFLKERFLLPQPRCALIPTLRTYACAALDISDGLLADLLHLCTESKLGAVLSCDQIPLSEAGEACVARQPALFKNCVTGGDDYEILFCVRSEKRKSFELAVREENLPVTRIGVCVAEFQGLQLEGQRATLLRDLDSMGYQHFR